MKSKLRVIWDNVEDNNKKGTIELARRRMPVQCKEGCVACCHQWVGVMPLEVDEMMREVARTGYDIPMQRLKEQADMAHEPGMTRTKWFARKSPCIFLRNESCAIYNARPLSCRALMVVSDPKECGTPDGTVKKVDNRRPVQRAFQAMAAEHAASARAPVVLPLGLAVLMHLENRSATELVKAGVYGVPVDETTELSGDGERVVRGAM